MNELLAPVGSEENLMAAINAGADAVYLSGPGFGARTDKANFDFDALKQAIKCAHLYGVKVYITVNTLIKEEELPKVYDYIDQLALLGVDAIIVQDLAVIAYIHRHYKHLPIHASTQMSVYDINGVRALRQFGVSRIVIARETKLSEIKHILKHEDVELEVFIHGALCHAFSGQCLISGVIGGRSGNRGKCAQTCRLKFNVDNAFDAYAMSMKDLSTIDAIETLKSVGISALKIEGRLRHADYVYHTVKAYRAAIDGVDEDKLRALKQNMYLSFNRSYTCGHLMSDQRRLTVKSGSNLGQEIGVVLSKKEKYKLELKLFADLSIDDALKFVTNDGDTSFGTKVFNIYKHGQKVQTAKAGESVSIDYQKFIPSGTKVYKTRAKKLMDERLSIINQKKLPLDISILIDECGQFKVTITSGKQSVAICDNSGEPPKHKPLDTAVIEKQFSKLGDTPFYLNSLNIQIDADIFMPASALNAIRRSATEQLIDRLWQRLPYTKERIEKDKVSFTYEQKPQIICLITTLEQFNALTNYSEIMVVTENKRLSQKLKIGLVKRPYSLHNANYDVTCDIGGLTSGATILDYHSQIMNTAAFDALYHIGIKDITLSTELEKKATIERLNQRPFRVFAYGKLPVMYSKTCIKKQQGQDCQSCRRHFTLTHPQSPDLVTDCNGEVIRYNTVLPAIREWTWIDLDAPLYVRFTDESKAEVIKVMDAITLKCELTMDRVKTYE